MTAPVVSPLRRFLSPGQIAEQLGIDLRKVLLWIKTGELKAANLATRQDSRKPRWRIAQIDVDSLILRRTATPPIKVPRRRRAPEGVTEYFR